MPVPLLVVVSGPPASGKTMLARQLAAQFRLPFISKDGIKETLYDALGSGDLDWSRRLGIASMRLLYYVAGAELAAERSCILESNFTLEYSSREFGALRAKHAFRPFWVQCSARTDVVLQRFKDRVESGSRHLGHADLLRYEALETMLRADRYAPPDIGGELVEIDTTDFGAIDYASLFQAIRSALEAPGGHGPVTDPDGA